MSDLVQKLIDAIELLEKEARLCDWQDPDARKAYVREYKRRQRERRIPENRVCPACGVHRPKSRSWVVRGKSAICRSCHFTRISHSP